MTVEYFSDVEINYDHIYLIKRSGERLIINTEWDARIGPDVAEPY